MRKHTEGCENQGVAPLELRRDGVRQVEAVTLSLRQLGLRHGDHGGAEVEAFDVGAP